MQLKSGLAAIDVFREKCREHGLKMTPQRLAIYDEVLKSKDHPNAEVLFKRVRTTLPDISFDTVNRTLLSFAETGIIDVVEGYGEPRRYDPDTKNHHHFRCINCGTIIDFAEESYVHIKVPQEIKKKFVVRNIKVLLEGYCHNCRKKI
jgi:Fur family peroxide stress response transcriptional regulator